MGLLKILKQIRMGQGGLDGAACLIGRLHLGRDRGGCKHTYMNVLCEEHLIEIIYGSECTKAKLLKTPQIYQINVHNEKEFVFL